MSVLKTIEKEKVKFLMDFDYNNVLGRLRYVLGKDAHFFADIRIKQKDITWSTKDDSSYTAYSEASESDKHVIHEIADERIKTLSAIISGDTLIGSYTERILSYPSHDYIYYAEKNGHFDVILTGWGCEIIEENGDRENEEINNAIMIQEVSDAEETDATVGKTEDDEHHHCEDYTKNDNINCYDDCTPIDDDNRDVRADIDETLSEERVYSSEWLKEHTKIHGWLSFFFFAIALGGLISAVYPITTFDVTDYAGNLWIGLIDVLLGVGLFAIAIYTIFAFCKRKPNAVFYGRLYVILVLVTNVISVIGNDGTGFEGMTQAIRGIAWGIVWFLYLLFSNQVQEVIPKPFRKVSKIDWGVLTTIIIVPCLCFVIGMLSLDSKEDNKDYQETEIIDSQEAEIKDKLEARISEEIKSKIRTNLESKIRNQKLTVNERTDGRVIFTIPNGFECNSQEIELSPDTPITLFTISNESIGNIYICSDYDNDTSLKHFDECWGNWESEGDKTLAKTNVEKGNRTVNGHTCMYRIVRYNVNGVHVYWRFYLLFDKSSGKCCVASFYDRNESTGYVNETLKSIRFK